MKPEDRRASDATPGRRDDVAGSLERVQLLFAWGGLAGGAVAGFVVLRASESWVSALFVALLMVYLIGRAACDLVTDDQKLRRAGYFAIFPVSAVALALSGGMFLPEWAAALLGLTVAWGVQQGVGWWLLPGIQAEEHADDLENVRGVFTPDDG